MKKQKKEEEQKEYNNNKLLSIDFKLWNMRKKEEFIKMVVMNTLLMKKK